MERCIRCKISEAEVKLYDSIYDGRPSMICERCAIIENIPIINKPNNSKAEEKPLTVFQRMKKMTGFKEEKRTESIILRERLKQLDERPEEKPKLELIEYFQWDIMRNRRRKGLTQEQFANSINEPITIIKSLELGEVPLGSQDAIKKIEQFLKIKLTKIDELEEIAESKRKPVVLRDEYGNILNHIPEPVIPPLPEPELEPLPEINETEQEVVCEIKEVNDKKTPLLNNMNITECRVEKTEINYPLGKKPYQMPYTKGRQWQRMQQQSTEVTIIPREYNLNKDQIEIRETPLNPKEILEETGELDIQKAKLNNLSIGSMRELHKQKLNLSKEDKILEARKIEQRQKMIEARKEELRVQKEKQSRDIDSMLGGAELLKKKDNFNPIKPTKTEEEVLEEDIDEEFERFEKD